MYKRLFLVILLITTTTLFAESVTVLVTPNIMEIGNTVRYSVTLRYLSSTKLISIPAKSLFNASSTNMQLIDYRFNKVFDKNHYTVRFYYDLKPLKVGIYKIPTHTIIFSKNKALKHHKFTNQHFEVIPKKSLPEASLDTQIPAQTPTQLSTLSTHKTSLSLQVMITPNTVTVGDPIRYSISLTYPKKSKLIELPPKTLFNDVSYDMSLIEYHLDKETLYYDVMVFETGTHRIPTHTITFSIESTLKKQVISDQTFTVVSVLPSTQKTSLLIKDITPLLLPPAPVKIIVTLLLVGGLVLLLSGGAILYFLKQRTRATSSTHPRDDRPIDIRYIEKFTQLKESEHYLNKNYAPFYSDLIKTLRHYLSERYVPIIRESTTSEIRHLLSQYKSETIPKPTLTQIKAVLDFGVLVKFARIEPDDADYNTIIDTCITIVKQTPIISIVEADPQ